MIIPQAVLDYKQALKMAVIALDWSQYQTILSEYQDYHASTSSKPFFLPHSSKLLLLAVAEVTDADRARTATNKALIIKSLIELGALTCFKDDFGYSRDFQSHDCNHSVPGDYCETAAIFKRCCIYSSVDEIKLLLAAGCQVSLPAITELLVQLSHSYLPRSELTRLLLVLQHSQLYLDWLFVDGVIDGQIGITVHFNRQNHIHPANTILNSVIGLKSDLVVKAFLIAATTPDQLPKPGSVVLHTLDFNRDEETINMLIGLGLIDHQVVDEYVKDRGDELSFVRLMLKKQKLVKL